MYKISIIRAPELVLSLSLLIRNISAAGRARAVGEGTWKLKETSGRAAAAGSAVSQRGGTPDTGRPLGGGQSSRSVGPCPCTRRFAAWQATGQPWSLRVRHVNTKKKRSRRTHPHVNNHFIIRAELKPHAHIGTPYLFNVESSRTSHRDVILHSVVSVEFWTKVWWDGCI